MTEFLGWMILIGLAVAIAGIYMLSSQIERRTRETLEFMLQSNAMIVAYLERTGGASLHAPDGLVGADLDRRRGERRDALSPLPPAARVPERRVSPDRRHGRLVLRGSRLR